MAGKAYDEIRALKRSAAEQYDLDIITPNDSLWNEQFSDLEAGDSWRLDELNE